MQLHVVASGLDPVNLVGPQEEQAPAGLDDETVGFRLITPEVLDQRQQPAADVAGLVALDVRASPLQRFLKTITIEGLEQVVQCPTWKALSACWS